MCKFGQMLTLEAAAVEDQFLHRVGQLFPRLFHVETVVVGERGHHLEVVGVAPVPAAHRPVRDAQLRVGRVEQLHVFALAFAHPDHSKTIAGNGIRQ